MITGLYNGTLFITDNEDIGASHIRPNLNPSNWFRNKYGLIIIKTTYLYYKAIAHGGGRKGLYGGTATRAR